MTLPRASGRRHGAIVPLAATISFPARETPLFRTIPNVPTGVILILVTYRGAMFNRKSVQQEIRRRAKSLRDRGAYQFFG
jgi:hypothetical protein